MIKFASSVGFSEGGSGSGVEIFAAPEGPAIGGIGRGPICCIITGGMPMPGGGAVIEGEALFSRSMLPNRITARIVPRF